MDSGTPICLLKDLYCTLQFWSVTGRMVIVTFHLFLTLDKMNSYTDS